ncbi:neural cell adhesion molecule L1-like isoform X2 [Biomphalaria glabrata]|uniref:Neural cell adhesion molecule L1-like isoform X2 n=1 Tax=Biomphalaria glabrata TaxID=6526 RepID=A0A9W2Z8E0_BIOGL|nr:neural cell adhesion molecule L1-like isoform X2 [Biomphalaria glabrata]
MQTSRMKLRLLTLMLATTAIMSAVQKSGNTTEHGNKNVWVSSTAKPRTHTPTITMLNPTLATSTKASLSNRIPEEETPRSDGVKDSSVTPLKEILHEIHEETKPSNGTKLDDESDSKEYTPPHITYPVSQELMVVYSDMFHIKCAADGHPFISYTWYRDDILLGDTDNHVKAYSNGSLLLLRYSNRESGYYQCRAKNQHGTSVSVKIPIFRDIKAESHSVESLPPIEVTEGDPLSLPCDNVTDTIPAYIKRWYYESKNEQAEITKRIGVNDKGTLMFAYVTKEDHKNFRCGLVPPKESTTITLYQPIPVNVKESPARDKIVKLAYKSNNVKGYVGKSVKLVCFFSGRPEPTVEWMDNKNKIIKESNRFKIDDFGRSLEIKNITEDDEGRFTCTGRNNLGLDSQTIDLNVTSGPLRIPSIAAETVALTKRIVPEGKNVTLNCKARPAFGEHTETPVWYRNGEILVKENLTDPERYSFNTDRTSLIIRNLTRPNDTACYQCNISNSEGYLFYDGYLRVIESIKITRKPESYIKVREVEGDIDLSVHVTSDACCLRSYVWLLNGTEMKISDFNKSPVFNYSTDCILRFQKDYVDESEWMKYLGNYTCIVSNSYEQVQVSATLSLEAEPIQDSLQDEEAGVQLWVILLIVGLLILLVAVIIVVVFIKTNFPRNTYPLEKTELKHHLNPEEDLLNQSFQEI